MGASPLSPGSAVDRYTIEALIGRGGMGEVYRAVDTRLRRKVALKVLRTNDPKNPDGVARLFREARAAAALSHPNTVAIHDLGESEDGLFYIVMELVSGQPLMAYVGDERVSLARKLKWLTEIAKALATAHKAGVIHRDVKPSNVMVSEEDVAKVLDFGLAKPMPKASGEPESFGFKTQAGRVLGTLRYMAPEQMIGSEADGRSDQYSLGMTAFELLAGRYPPGKAFDVPPLLNTILAGFPADGALAIARMLKRIPEDRFVSMDDVSSAFEDIAANRPVRALGIMPGPKPARHVVIEDKTVLDPPNKHSPETLPEKPIGSTLTSAEDDLSADTIFAIEDALQPTVSPAELAKEQMGLAATLPPRPPSPGVAIATVIQGGAAEEAPFEGDDDGAPSRTLVSAADSPEATTPSGPVISGVAASSTLQSADAGDRVRAVREATAKEMAREAEEKAAAAKATSPLAATDPVVLPMAVALPKAGGEVATTLASEKKSELVVEIRKASESEPKPKSEPRPKSSPAGSTLASKGANDAVMAVRAATTPKAKAPVTVESVPPPPKDAPAAKKNNNVLWFVLTIAFLALSAFAGTYFGARSRKD